MSFRKVTTICVVAASISLASACSSSDVTQPPDRNGAVPGSIQVTVATTGLATDTNGYNLRLDGSSLASGINLQSNGVATLSVAAGAYAPKLFGVAPNCDLVTPLPATLSIKAGGSTPVTLKISCGAPTTLAVVRAYNHICSMQTTDQLCRQGDEAISTVNSDGTGEELIPGQSGSNFDPAWSPDGNRIAFVSTRDGTSQIYLMDPDGRNVLRLTTSGPAVVSTGNTNPAWSPDGTRIAFVSERDGNAEIYAMNSDGTNPVRLTIDKSWNGYPSWSPDGNRIAFASERNGASAIWVMNADGSAPRQLSIPTADDSRPAWSPDGTKIAFNYSGAIAVMNSDGSKLTILTQGFDEASDPSWSQEGSKIAFTVADFSSTYVAVVGLDGVNGSLSLSFSARQPAWRPR